MYKDKNNKVFASLTEVKNKTGDIFSLVDEYGEITLTSYNKPKYKISKIDITEVVGLEETETNGFNVMNALKSRVTSIVSQNSKEQDTPVEEEPTLIDRDVLKKLSKLRVWDRKSRKEMNYVQIIKSPLQ